MNEQEQRFILRERFLRMLNYMENKKLYISTYQGADVNGVFRSVDYNISNFHLSNLQTPIGQVPEALIRTSDISLIKFSIDE